MDTTQAETVYQLVTDIFTELGAQTPLQIGRSLLLQNGFYVGQAYRCDGWRARWMMGKSSVEFCDDAGHPCRTVSLPTEPVKKAA